MRTQRLFLAALAAAMVVSQASADTVALGKIEFLVDTNVKMFKFKGDAEQLSSKLDRIGSQLKHLELTIPVSSLKTGMELRDKHMVERVFTRPDGTTPDIVFTAGPQDGTKCTAGCKVDGTLTLRGETRAQVIQLTMKDPSHVEGTAQISLTQFGIQPPEQVGVKVSDTIDVNFSVDLKQ